jgi:3-dehydroquinate dehydratase-1
LYHLRDGKPFSPENPRVCAPVLEESLPRLLSAVRRAASAADAVEWRADYYGRADDLLRASRLVRESAGDAPLIFTFRSPMEGGAERADEQARISAIAEIAEDGGMDFVDIELSCGGAARVREACRRSGSRLIVSYHDFEKTPSAEIVLKIMRAALAEEADAVKTAFMPASPADVISLLTAADLFRQETQTPLIAVSMGSLGLVSRAFGHVFGSAMTFASLGKPSAPGQIPVKTLRKMLESEPGL